MMGDRQPLANVSRRAHPVVLHGRGRRLGWLLAALAHDAPVFLLDEPVFADDVSAGTLDVTTPWPNVWRAVPRLPRAVAFDRSDAMGVVRHLAQGLIGEDSPMAATFRGSVQWFRSAQDAPFLLGAFGSVAMVFEPGDARHRAAVDPRTLSLLLGRATAFLTWASDEAIGLPAGREISLGRLATHGGTGGMAGALRAMLEQAIAAPRGGTADQRSWLNRSSSSRDMARHSVG